MRRQPPASSQAASHQLASLAAATLGKSVVALHPSELFGEDWMASGLDARKPDPTAAPEAPD
ncbi:hypothetical protein [Rivibacter subsaxonicus]|uniref:hypothetical protein n=1 Tax=Rivibacter subsaxonicus TaxID=457575 RepID=UPI00102B077C|nr:hypothetical protein [Rivibacter subsaxonicus]